MWHLNEQQTLEVHLLTPKL